MRDEFDDRPNITYSDMHQKAKLKSIIKILLSYILIMGLWFIIVRLYNNFGTKWIAPAVAAMWIAGSVTTLIIKEERAGTIKQTKMAVLFFLLFLLMYRVVIQKVTPITSDDIASAFDIAIPVVSGLSISGMLQNILLIVSVMTPIGYVVWCAQKFKNYHGRQTKREAFHKIKDIRK